jgi:hypothetical protein
VNILKYYQKIFRMKSSLFFTRINGERSVHYTSFAAVERVVSAAMAGAIHGAVSPSKAVYCVVASARY